MKHSRNTQRAVKNKLYVLSKKIHFLLGRLSLPEKLCLAFLLLSLISLFSSWLTLGGTENNIQKISSFSPILGSIGFFLSFVIITSIYKIFACKNTFHLPIPQSFRLGKSQLIFWGGVILLTSSLHSYITIRGLSYFDSSINHSFGLILSITSSIMLLGISFVMRSEEKNTQVGGSFIGEKNPSTSIENKDQKEENMKLPV